MRFEIFNYTICIGFDDRFHLAPVIPRLRYTGKNFQRYLNLHKEAQNKWHIVCCPELCAFEWSYLLKPRITIKKRQHARTNQ